MAAWHRHVWASAAPLASVPFPEPLLQPLGSVLLHSRTVVFTVTIRTTVSLCRYFPQSPPLLPILFYFCALYLTN
jgi:hypothetical protein